MPRPVATCTYRGYVRRAFFDIRRGGTGGGAKVMAWWNKKVVFPVKRAWEAATARVKSRKHGDGILKLRDDVQMCGSQDVQVMWEMVRRSETAVSQATKRHKRQFWRPSACSSRTSACDDPTEPSHHH
ncbi:hypothetical protein GW17_00058185 [Ensete ventricosum]|nr:hypothetical protein GW17_00058185 [Ensete ventricosum]